MGEMSEHVSPALLHQRIRSCIIEYLELAASSHAQHAYQAAVPSVHEPNEIINQWQDWVSDPRDEIFREPVFSPDEQLAIRNFHAVWESVADDTPDPLPPLSELISSEPWERLRRAAEEARQMFRRRRLLDEEAEQYG